MSLVSKGRPAGVNSSSWQPQASAEMLLNWSRASTVKPSGLGGQVGVSGFFQTENWAPV